MVPPDLFCLTLVAFYLQTGEFKQRLEEEFDFMVAPLVFDLELRVDPTSLAPAQHPVAGDVAATADVAAASGSGASASAAGAAGGGWRVQHVYGSPDSEERRLSGAGSIMRVGLRGGLRRGGFDVLEGGLAVSSADLACLKTAAALPGASKHCKSLYSGTGG